MILKQAERAGFLLVCVLCSLFIASGVSFAVDGGVGMVIALEGSAVARRNGADAALALKDRVFVSDAITASAGAKIQILLDDDSAITIAQNSTVRISDFLDSGSDSKFGAHVSEGRARIVTGRITENNPEGFNVTTKHAAIGIRGTILTITATEDRTQLDVENTDKVVLVNGASVPEFHRAVVLGGGVPELSPLPPEDRENDALLSSGGGSGMANNGGETGQTDAANNGEEPGQADALLALGGGLAEQTAPDMKIPAVPDPVVPDPVLPRYAHASGTINYNYGYDDGDRFELTALYGVTFGFDLNLETGAISGAEIDAAGSFTATGGTYYYDMNFHDGKGTADAGGFRAEDFAGTLTATWPDPDATTRIFVDDGSYIAGGADLLILSAGGGGGFAVEEAAIKVKNVDTSDDSLRFPIDLAIVPGGLAAGSSGGTID
jgi:hypothetical protein